MPNRSQSQIRTGLAYLKVMPGTRQLGMAGALTGAIDHMAAIYANPGATGLLREWQWSTSYTRWIPDVYDASVFYGRRAPWSRRGRVAVGLSYLGVKNFDSTNGREPAEAGSDVLAMLSIGQPFEVAGGKLALGGNVKYFRSTLAQYYASTLVFDAGLLWRTPKFSFIRTGLGLWDEAIFSAGVAVTQMGSHLRFLSAETPLPRTVRAGIALNTGSHRALQFAISADYRSIRDEEPFVAIGTEISWQHVLSLRGGYHFEQENILGHVSVGLSIGLDDTRTNLAGLNNAARFDFAKSESNLFFSSPARAGLNHFPIRPEAFSFIAPAPDAVTLSTDVQLAWQPARDPDLFDDVEYVVLVAQQRAELEQILTRVEFPNRENLIALFADSTRLFSGTMLHRVTPAQTVFLNDLTCGDYFWSVVAFDRDHHFRLIEHDGEHIARFTVGTADLTVTDIQPGSPADGCGSSVDVVVANRGNASASLLSLALFNAEGVVAQRRESLRLAPGEQFIFRNIDIGLICEPQLFTAWINPDMAVPECDTTNNRLQKSIRSHASHDLRISKTADVQVVQPGELIHYTLTISNVSCCPAREVQVVDHLPIFVKASRFQAPLPVDSTETDSLLWDLGTLPANAQITIRYAARIEPFTVRINFQNDRYRWNQRDLVDYARAQRDMDNVAARLSALLSEHEAMRLNIAGYTSSPGSAPYNLQLSENRSYTIHDQLVRRLKDYNPRFDEKRITSEGRGENPAFRKIVDDLRDTVDAAGRVLVSRRAKQEANRRVEIEFFNLPDIINSSVVRSSEHDREPSDNLASVTVKIKP